MIERLQKNPNQLFQFSEDSEAKVLLFELGLIDKFSKGVQNIASTNQVVTGLCPTHYILAMFFTGKTIQSDNGYLVYAVPRSQVSPKQMGDFMSQIMAKLKIYSHETITEKMFSPDSSEN